MILLLILVPLCAGVVAFWLPSQFGRRALLLGAAITHACLTTAVWMHRPAEVLGGWLQLDEPERIDLVIAYHRHYCLTMGRSPKLHGTVHAIVENQVAAGDATVVSATLARLIREGLDRHDAIHAIGSVLAAIIFDVVAKKADAGLDINTRYGHELGALTAASWRARANDRSWRPVGRRRPAGERSLPCSPRTGGPPIRSAHPAPSADQRSIGL